MGSINSLSSSYVQSVLNSVLQNSGLTTKTGNSLSSADVSSSALQPDNGQLSPFAQLLNTLQQLQQSDPTKYQQVTQQIATNLQSAAQTAQTSGNTTAANQLTQLATDFNSASMNGQIPNIQDLAQAMGGHHHHHHVHSGSAGSSSDSSTSGSATQALSQLLSAFESTNGTQSDSLNPMTIILNTLANAGISSTNA